LIKFVFVFLIVYEKETVSIVLFLDSSRSVPKIFQKSSLLILITGAALPPVFDPIDPIDMKSWQRKICRSSLQNGSFGYANNVHYTWWDNPIDSKYDGGGNSSNGNSTILGELGIRQDMVDQELQEALNLVVCVPSMMNNTTEMGST